MKKFNLTVDFDSSEYELSHDEKHIIIKSLYTAFKLAGFSDDSHLTFLPVSIESIHSLNKEYKHKDRATDVLSFPQYDDQGFYAIEGEDVFLGDIVICPQKLKEQAEQYIHSYERELRYICVHSALHLLGYDHIDETDKKEMRSMEKKIIAELEKEDDEFVELIKNAKLNLKNSYAPYSNIHVSAAVLCEDGTIFKGVNVENASYGAGICAERSAIVSAISAGKSDFKAIAICSDLDKAISPCGICRQFIAEFSSDIEIILGDEDNIKIYTISDLLPLGFGKNDFDYIVK